LARRRNKFKVLTQVGVADMVGLRVIGENCRSSSVGRATLL
jgi:hypothetical protein